MTQYATLIGCCETLTDELVIEALYESPSLELAESATSIANARGYSTTPGEILEDLYA